MLLRKIIHERLKEFENEFRNIAKINDKA